MSRNKIIKNVHKVTHAPFSECRAALNAVEWNEEQAIAIITINRIPDAIDALATSIANFVNNIPNVVERLTCAAVQFMETRREILGNLVEEPGEDMTGGTI